jgi:hypothetical protein
MYLEKFFLNTEYMQTFHIIVLSIAAILLIILLTFIGIIMGKQKSTTAFPPTMNTCPDFWQVSTDGKSCIIPNYNSINKGKLYNGSLISTDLSNPAIVPGFSQTTDSKNKPIYSINFNDAGWAGTGVQGICSKRKWANNYQIEWDGVSNYTACPTAT